MSGSLGMESRRGEESARSGSIGIARNRPNDGPFLANSMYQVLSKVLFLLSDG